MSDTTITNALRRTKIDALDAELLLSRVLQCDRAWLLAHGEVALTDDQEKRFHGFTERRMKHEPVAYILEEKEFYGRTLHVDRSVLIPRPATEALIDEVKSLFQNTPPHHLKTSQHKDQSTSYTTKADADVVILTHLFAKKTTHCDASGIHRIRQRDIVIVDIGTGSGCIAVTLALELSDAEIIATDISRDALEVAKINAKKYGVLDQIEFTEADGLFSKNSKPLNLQSPFLLVSNPPYIPEGSPLPPDVLFYEPREALFAGANGMSVITALIEAANEHPFCLGIVMEMRQDQSEVVLAKLSN